MPNTELDKRYKKFGGLRSTIKRFGEGELSLEDIAKSIDYSRETVRNDIKREIGTDGYDNLVIQKRQSTKAQPEAPLTLSEVKKRVADLLREADTGARDELEGLAKVLNELERAGVSLTATLTRSGHMRFTLADGTPLSIRIAEVSGDQREHGYGFYRFKISPSKAASVFAIKHADGVVYYVFRPAELGNVKSLNLRFSDESKYAIERTSKYDEARDRWSVLKRKRA